ncbi:MAG: RNA 2',3'-cyclic phosphodiesterase [Chloroflexi bacterium]|nr:RNA 2',3'-cyclic phosphodiesterase [Chloroflexota bacterium]
MDKLRCFIAIELPQQIKIVLSQLQILLGKERDNSIKWVNPNNIHLTLKFLGSINSDSIPLITDAMKSCIKTTSPFSLSIGDTGAFPNTQSPRVSWVGLKGDSGALLKLQKQLDQVLSEIGFAPETREFSPHLTLGRIRDGAR